VWDAADFGLQIQKARKAQGLTQEQLGARAGVTAQAVSKWENGDASPDIALLPELCAALEASADALLGTTRRQGVEALSRGLRERLDAMRGEDHTRARSAATARLLTRDGHDAQGNFLEVGYHQQRDGRNRLQQATLILTDGGAIHIRGEGGFPPAEDQDAAIAGALALLGDPVLVGILRRLVADRGQGGVLRTEARTDPATRAACDRLIEAGWASLGQEGYGLDPPGVLLAATVLTLVGVCHFASTHAPGLMSASMFQSHDHSS